MSTAKNEAAAQNWKVPIALVDDGGHPLTLIRLDDAPPISAYIAIEKAKTASLGRRDSKHDEDMVNNGRLTFTTAPMPTPLEDGVPIFVEGQVIGAPGVFGVTSSQDTRIANAGVAVLDSAR